MPQHFSRGDENFELTRDKRLNCYMLYCSNLASFDLLTGRRLTVCFLICIILSRESGGMWIKVGIN